VSERAATRLLDAGRVAIFVAPVRPMTNPRPLACIIALSTGLVAGLASGTAQSAESAKRMTRVGTGIEVLVLGGVVVVPVHDIVAIGRAASRTGLASVSGTASVTVPAHTEGTRDTR
jgi:hypothetical protein